MRVGGPLPDPVPPVYNAAKTVPEPSPIPEPVSEAPTDGDESE